MAYVRANSSGTRTVPARTRATGVRIKSTIIRFSARSLSLSASEGERGVVLGADAARPCPFDGARLDVPRRVHAQEALRRCAEHGRLREVEIGGEGCGISKRRRRCSAHAGSVSGASKRCDRLA